MGFKMVIVPPNAQPDWPQKIRAAVPDCQVHMFDSAEAAMDAIVDADAAYGNVGPELLRRARSLRWIQAPAAAPPAGYYYKELIESDVVVTNQREIYTRTYTLSLHDALPIFEAECLALICQPVAAIGIPDRRVNAAVYAPHAAPDTAAVASHGSEA